MANLFIDVSILIASGAIFHIVLIKLKNYDVIGLGNNKRFIKNKVVYLCWVFIMLLLIPLVNLGIYQHKLPQIELRTYNNLQAIANIKVQQMTRWLDYRVADASVLASDQQLSNDIAQQLHNKDLRTSKIIKARFESLIKSYHYESIALLNASGVVVLQSGGYINNENAAVTSVDQNLIKAVNTSYQIKHGDFLLIVYSI